MTHEQIIKLAREAAKGSHRMELATCFGLQGIDELERFSMLCRAELVDQIEAITKERDALAAAADSHKVIRDTLTARLNVLEAAAKLALDSLSVSYPTVRSRLRAHNAAIEALRQAGVR